MSIPGTRILATSCIAALVAAGSAASFAQGSDGSDRLAGTRLIASPHAFDVLVGQLEESIEANRMGIVARASAGAAARGVKIPGNLVLMVFRNDRSPSAVFAPYRNAKLDTLAGELDRVFDRIIGDAVAP